MTDASLPKVSVVIATRERPVLLHRAIRRVMEQTYAGEIEVVIVFDQSEPHPIEVDVPAHRSLTVIRNTERNPGLAGARNSGVLATSGEWVAFCDDDDEWLPEKLTRQMAALQANPGCEIATSGIWVVYDDKTIPRVFPKDRITLTDLLQWPPALVTVAIRLVPLATLGGRPRKMRSGSVRNDPPPASTFKAPDAAPTATRASPSIQEISTG